MKNPKSQLENKAARIAEARDRYRARAKDRPRQTWITTDDQGNGYWVRY